MWRGRGGRLRGQVAALTADGRMSALVLGLLPPGVALVLALVNPDYMGALTERRLGQVMLVLAATLLVSGWLSLRRLIRPVF